MQAESYVSQFRWSTWLFFSFFRRYASADNDRSGMPLILGAALPRAFP
jgi:hypothetical protein